MKSKLNPWLANGKRIIDNRRILILVFLSLFFFDFVVGLLISYVIIPNMETSWAIFVYEVLLTIVDVLTVSLNLLVFLILNSLFNKSRLYAGVQWIVITLLMVISSLIIDELPFLVIHLVPLDAFYLSHIVRVIMDLGFTEVGTYLEFQGTFFEGFGYFTDLYRLIPLLVLLLPFIRFVMSFGRRKTSVHPTGKRPVGSTILTVISNLVTVMGCFGVFLFIIMLPSVEMIEGYEPIYTYVYLFLAALFVPFIVLGTLGSRQFKRKTTEKFVFNLNFINGFFNILAFIFMLVLALASFLSPHYGVSYFEPKAYIQMGWISMFFGLFLAINSFRILIQNKPLWMIENKALTAKHTESDLPMGTENTEFRAPIGIMVPITKNEPITEETDG